MKNFSTGVIFLVLVCVALEAIIIPVNARFIASTKSGTTRLIADDVQVILSASSWKCDRIECPQDTERCYASKRVSSHDSQIIEREDICYGANGEVLNILQDTESAAAGATIDLQINVYRNGTYNYKEDSDFDVSDSQAQQKDVQEQFQRIREQFAHGSGGFGTFF